MADFPHTPFPIDFSQSKVKIGVIFASITGLLVVGVVIGFVILTITYNFNILNWIE
jgi:hypothetical protein